MSPGEYEGYARMRDISFKVLNRVCTCKCTESKLQLLCDYDLHWTTVRASVYMAVRFIIVAFGMLMVAEQEYGPLSEKLSGEKTYSTKVVFTTNIMVELGKIMTISGIITRSDGTSDEQ